MNQRRFFWLILGLSLVLLIPGLGLAPLWIYDEVRNAQCAREMFENNEWIVPTFNGKLRTLKPPLHYYFMFAGFEMFGINEWGARFFSAICGVFTIMISFVFIQRYSSTRHAFITCLALLSSTHFLFQFRMSVPDPYLILLNTISVFTAYAFFKENKLSWLLISALCFGLAILAKGPVALVLPAAGIIIWLIWEARWRELFNWRILLAAVVMLLVAAPWYILVHNATGGEWTKGFFLQHNVGRFSEPMEGHGGIFLVVPLFVLLGMLPSSVFVGEALKNFRRRFSNSLMRLSLSVVLVFLLFYSISGTKLPNYPMPCYPFLAILLGYVINKGLYEEKIVKIYPFLILLFLNIALPVAAYFGLKNEENTKGYEDLAAAMFILTLAAMTAVYFMMRKHFRRALIAVASLYLVFHLLFFNWLYPVIYRQNPMTKTIEMVKKYESVVAYQFFHPSFTYYLPQRIPVFYNVDSLRRHLDTVNAAVLSRKKFEADLQGIDLKEQAAVRDLFEGNTTVVYSRE